MTFRYSARVLSACGFSVSAPSWTSASLNASAAFWRGVGVCADAGPDCSNRARSRADRTAVFFIQSICRSDIREVHDPAVILAPEDPGRLVGNHDGGWRN